MNPSRRSVRPLARARVSRRPTPRTRRPCSDRGSARSVSAAGVGLRELARRLDLSPSSISQIETGKMQPSVRTLYAFVSGVRRHGRRGALRPGRPRRRTERPRRHPSPGRGGPGLAVQRADGTTGDHAQLRRDVGAADVLGGRRRRVHRGDLRAGGRVRPRRRLVRHSGHEFGYVLSGTLRVVVGFDEFILGPGDSITFPSSTPHRLSNEGNETVRAIWVVRGRRGANPHVEASAGAGARATNGAMR